MTGVLSGLRAQGRDPAAVLGTGQVDPAILADETLRIPIANYAALYNAVVQELQDEGLGLFAAPIAPGMFEFLCRGMLSSRTLEEALDRAARFLRVVLPDLEVKVRRGRHEAHLVRELVRREVLADRKIVHGNSSKPPILGHSPHPCPWRLPPPIV